jgi:hypothetical protein
MDTPKNDKKPEPVKFRVKRIKLASGKMIRIISIYSLFLLLLAIPLTVTFMRQQTTINQRASGKCTPLPSCFYDNSCKYPLDLSKNNNWCEPIKPVVLPTCVPVPSDVMKEYKITQTPANCR